MSEARIRSSRQVPDGADRHLLVIDDWFPNLGTGFRIAEFVHYLRIFPWLRVASTCSAALGHYERFAERYPDVSDRVTPWNPDILRTTRAAWFVFLNNAYQWVAEMERHAIPFAFTLYPGGGFELASSESEAKLARVLTSPMLRSVVATQPATLERLRRMCCPVATYDIPGLVINPAYVATSQPRTALREAGVIRICFAAFRYDPGGRNKGFPEFLNAASMLAQLHPHLRFAVAGDLGPEDWPVPESLASRITFHGPLATNELRQFFLGQDVIVSPTRRFAVTGSEFDGFPTGTCVEAALCGVMVLCSDELDQNRFYRPNEEILICAPRPDAIVMALDAMLRDTSRLVALAEAGRRRSVELYSVAAQLIPRTRILRALANEAGLPG
jgi:lipopolysaccharide transport system ATP-binding protein